MSRDWANFDWQHAVYNQGDLIPGNPSEVAALGRELRKTASMIQDQITNLQRVVDGDGWDSDSGRAFKDKVKNTTDLLQKAFGRYNEAAGAIGGNEAMYGPFASGTNWAAQLQEAQDAAKKALTAGRNAQADSQSTQKQIDTANHSTPDGKPDTSPAAFRLADQKSTADEAVLQAGRDMQAAIDQRDHAAHAVAAAINDYIDHDGLKDPKHHFWDIDWKNLIADIGHIAGIVAAVAGILALCVGWIPIIGQVLAGILGTIALIASVVALVADTISALDGKGNWFDVAIDVVGLASFGMGRALGSAVKVGGEAATATKAVRVAKGLSGTVGRAKGWAVSKSIFGMTRNQAGRAFRASEGNWFPGIKSTLGSMAHPFESVAKGASQFEVNAWMKAARGTSYLGKTRLAGALWYGSQAGPIAAAVANFQVPDDLAHLGEPSWMGPNFFKNHFPVGDGSVFDHSPAKGVPEVIHIG